MIFNLFTISSTAADLADLTDDRMKAPDGSQFDEYDYLFSR